MDVPLGCPAVFAIEKAGGRRLLLDYGISRKYQRIPFFKERWPRAQQRMHMPLNMHIIMVLAIAVFMVALLSDGMVKL